MNWQAAMAAIAAIALVGGYLRWSIGMTVEAAISKAIAKLLERLDERYVPAAKSSVTGAEIERRLEAMEALERPVMARRSA